MKKKRSKITESQIEGLCTAQSFERGYDYFQSGMLSGLVARPGELSGYCAGSGYEPYRLVVRLDEQGIGLASCSCPYDWGGICKHLVALLLAWVHEPETFQDLPALNDQLANRSKEELIALIEEMLKREPHLSRLLDLPLNPEPHQNLDLTAFERQIKYALSLHDNFEYGYPDAQSVADELTNIIDIADGYIEAGDWRNAGALYTLVLQRVVPVYDELYDQNGDVSLVLQSCAEGLNDCLEAGEPDEATHRRWIEALLEADLKDVAMGGIDLAAPAGDLVLEHASDEEWTWIEDRIREAIAAQSGRFSEWPRARLVNFLGRRLADQELTDERTALILELGSAEQRANLLVQQGRFDEALTIARDHFHDKPGLVIQFADTLVTAGAGEHAEAFVGSLLDTRYGNSYLAWLAERSVQTGRPSVALEQWRRLLREAPRLGAYQSLRQTAQELGQWDSLKPQVLDELKEGNAWSVLIEIALDEANVPWALELLNHERQRRRAWYGHNYELQVAQAAEKEYPYEAIALYQHQAERLIAARGRGNYHEAAQLLLKVRELYRRENDEQGWQIYITGLRRENSNLPALRDELNKAGL